MHVVTTTPIRPRAGGWIGKKLPVVAMGDCSWPCLLARFGGGPRLGPGGPRLVAAGGSGGWNSAPRLLVGAGSRVRPAELLTILLGISRIVPCEGVKTWRRPR